MAENGNVHVNGNNSGIINTGNDNKIEQNIHLPRHIIPKALTKEVGLANKANFVGRTKELESIDRMLKESNTLLLINGIGGIGKSTIASYYLGEQQNNFAYYGYIQVNDDIKLSLTTALRSSLDLKQEKIDDLFIEAINKLQNLKGKKLLIIDDLKDIANQKQEIETLANLSNSNFQILFTSREVEENIPQYFLDIMSIEDARELFTKWYPTDEIAKVDEVLKYLDYHTFFIEMTAKTLTQRKHTLTLDKLLEKFKKGEFTAIKKIVKRALTIYLMTSLPMIKFYKMKRYCFLSNGSLFYPLLKSLLKIYISFWFVRMKRS